MESRSLTLLLSVLISTAPAIGSAQDELPPSNPRCVDLTRIDRTETIGDRSILFHMRDGTIYQNELPQACPALGRNRPFMYRPMLNRLCDTDVITVLDSLGFGGFAPVSSCLLGEFRRIDEDAAEALRNFED